MSDIMLHGVLNMPPELWSGEPIDVMQRHSRYVQASEYIYELTEQRDRLIEAIKEHKATMQHRQEFHDSKLYEALQSLTTNEPTSEKI